MIKETTLPYLYSAKEGDIVTLTGKITSNNAIGSDSDKNRWYALGIKLIISTGVAQIKPGQFFNLRAKHSKVLLGRPISVYSGNKLVHKDVVPEMQMWNGKEDNIKVLIMRKGTGTSELTDLKIGEEIELVGPLGNGFPEVTEDDKVCAIGGGIGIAPILGVYENMLCKPEDLYICLKHWYYDEAFKLGLARSYSHRDVIEWSKTNLAVEKCPSQETITDRIMVPEVIGKEGMLDAILTADILKDKGYTKVFACGPKPMLRYVRDICRKAGVKAYLSLENYMACGIGACLGCTIPTTEGNKRCCKDGPVFDADILDPYFGLEEEKPIGMLSRKRVRADLSLDLAGVWLKSPIIAASGTFGYGKEYLPIKNEMGVGECRYPFKYLGGICSKGLTLEPRSGNPGRRLYETPMGLMNSIGLENPGIPHFIEHELEDMLKVRWDFCSDERHSGHAAAIIANLSGSDTHSYVEGARLLEKTDVDMIELNISCPNIKAGGMAFGMEPDAAADITAAVKAVTQDKPLIVKLTPNAPDLVGVAMAVREAGADALSLVNTFQALAIDIETGKPIFDNIFAGLSGPAIKPIALRMVYSVAKAMGQLPEDQQIPIIGIGGISTWQDVVEFIMAGATAVQIGTANFADPLSTARMCNGLEEYMTKHELRSIEEFRGIALK